MWGLTTDAYTGTHTITFPYSFTTTCYVVIPKQFKKNNNDYDKTVVTAKSNTGFTQYNSAYAMRYQYIALGD